MMMRCELEAQQYSVLRGSAPAIYAKPDDYLWVPKT